MAEKQESFNATPNTQPPAANVPQNVAPSTFPQPATAPVMTAPQPAPLPVMTVPQHATVPVMTVPQTAPVTLMTAPVPTQQPFVYQMGRAHSRPRTIDDFSSKTSINLGVIQIVGAIMAIILNGVGFYLQIRDHYDYSYGWQNWYQWYPSAGYFACSGFYGAVLFIISGAFAICAGKTKSRCQIITQLVMSSIASVFAGIMLCMAIWVVVVDSNRLKEGFYVINYQYGYDPSGYGGSDSNYGYVNYGAAHYAKASLGVSVLFLLVSIMELAVCVWGSTLCCRVCCGRTSGHTNPRTVQYVTSPQGQQQVIILDNYGRPLPNVQTLPVTSGMVQMPQTVFLQGGAVATGQVMVPAVQQQTMAPPGYMAQQAGSPPPYQGH